MIFRTLVAHAVLQFKREMQKSKLIKVDNNLANRNSKEQRMSRVQSNVKKFRINKTANTLFILMLTMTASSAYAKEVVVEILKKQFIPATITINKGDTVIWKNIEKRQYHNVWFKSLDQEEPEYFFPDESYQRTFMNTGVFNYECGPHPKMTGIVTVID